MRAMTALTALIAARAEAAVLWRLGAPTTRAATAARPATIWSTAHIGAGTLRLHATILLLCCNKIVGPRLSEALAARLRCR